jgi:hypothetical protein
LVVPSQSPARSKAFRDFLFSRSEDPLFAWVGRPLNGSAVR